MDILEMVSWNPTKDDINETLLYYIFQHYFFSKKLPRYSFSEYTKISQKLTYSHENLRTIKNHAKVISDQAKIYIKSVTCPSKNDDFFHWSYPNQLFYQRFLYFFYLFRFQSELDINNEIPKRTYINIHRKKFSLFLYPIFIGIIDNISHEGFIKGSYADFKEVVLSTIRTFYSDSSYYFSPDIIQLEPKEFEFIYKYYLDIFLPDELYQLAQKVDELKTEHLGNITDIWNAFEHPIEIKGLSEYLYFICFSSRTLQKLYYKILLNDMEIQQILRLPEDQKNTQGLQLPPQFTYKDRKIGQLHRDVQQVGSILNQIDEYFML